MNDEARYDVVVVGSGGAGLVAACAAADRGAHVLVLEAGDLFGGTTALSGGQLWIPDTAQMRRSGYHDSKADALTYLGRITMGANSSEHLSAFLQAGPRLADYLEDELDLPLHALARGDYHPTWNGAGFGRSLEPLPVPTAALGPLRKMVRTSPLRGPLTSTESRSGIDPAALALRHREDVRTQGSGLVAGLVAAAVGRGVTLANDHRVTAVHPADHGYAGWRIEARTSFATLAEFSSGAVVLACGGFAGSAALRADFLPPIPMLSTAAGGSLGDAIRLGLANGAHLKGMNEAWWTPAVAVPPEGPHLSPTNRNLVRELAYPGSVLINAAGVRFVDEASSYNDLGKAFLRFDAAAHRYPNAVAWLVFDATFKNRYSVAGMQPSQEVPGWVRTAGDLASLAVDIGVDPAGLATTVESLAAYAAAGVDPDFGRGGNDHDIFNGDLRHHRNPCLGALSAPPFYAIEVSLGLNGTKGGLVTDPLGAVLDHDNQPIGGLFACGEAAAALMGPGYAGSGASLGPALTTGMTIGESVVLRNPGVNALPRVVQRGPSPAAATEQLTAEMTDTGRTP